MNNKIIVTHIFPDLDAITSVWLLKRFDSQFEGAGVELVPAGKTYKDEVVDSDPEVVHVDTGMGRFDHHHTGERTCAARLIFDSLSQENKIPKKYLKALERLIEVVIQVDHFEDFFWDEPASDKYDFCLHHLFDFLKMSGQVNDKEMVVRGSEFLEAVLFGLGEKIKSEEEIEKGVEFETIWGKSIGLETKFSRVSKLAQKMGYVLVVRKEPETGLVSIKCQPKKELDLSEAFKILKVRDTQADWFFHKSKHIILNGSRHNPKVKPSNLSLQELIKILRDLKKEV